MYKKFSTSCITHTHENGQNPQHCPQQVLARTQSRRVLVAMRDGAATLEDGWEVPYKTKRILTTRSKQSSFLVFTRRN